MNQYICFLIAKICRTRKKNFDKSLLILERPCLLENVGSIHMQITAIYKNIRKSCKKKNEIFILKNYSQVSLVNGSRFIPNYKVRVLHFYEKAPFHRVFLSGQKSGSP